MCYIYIDVYHVFSFFCNSLNILCIFCAFAFVFVFLVRTSLASYISIALREVIRLPPASIDPSLPSSHSLQTSHSSFLNLCKPCVIHMCVSFSLPITLQQNQTLHHHHLPKHDILVFLRVGASVAYL